MGSSQANRNDMNALRITETLRRVRDATAIATAFTLPLTTSGLAVTSSIFAILALLTIKPGEWHVTALRPAAIAPALLFLLLLLGMVWSPTPLGPGEITHYVKLLFIPLIMACSLGPRQALHIGYGLLAGCFIVLALSWMSLLWPSGPWGWFKVPNIPVKDNSVQSACFALCAFGLAVAAVQKWSFGKRGHAIAMAALALLFFTNIFAIYVSKTGMLEALMLGLFSVWLEGWRRALLIVASALVIMGIALSLSTRAQMRLHQITADIRADNTSQESISTASRRDFYDKAIGFVKDAPLFGHGTGSTKSLFQSLESARPSPYGEAVPDPHNQFLAIAIQVGLIGGVLLLAMWATHLMTFFGRGVVNVLGQAVVLQNVVGSLFNSHLSTVTEGTLYCLAVGLLAGLVHWKKA